VECFQKISRNIDKNVEAARCSLLMWSMPMAFHGFEGPEIGIKSAIVFQMGHYPGFFFW
jgi:hypothetical protein